MKYLLLLLLIVTSCEAFASAPSRDPLPAECSHERFRVNLRIRIPGIVRKKRVTHSAPPSLVSRHFHDLSPTEEQEFGTVQANTTRHDIRKIYNNYYVPEARTPFHRAPHAPRHADTRGCAAGDFGFFMDDLYVSDVDGE